MQTLVVRVAVALVALLAAGSASGRPAALTVTITGGPADPTTRTSATFAFTASVRASAFECRLDGGRAAPCSSGVSYSGLALGAHRFLVVASGGREQASASWSWTVVAERPPELPPVPAPPTIYEAPPAEAASAEAMFAFRGGWPAFECSLDGAAPAACASPAWYSGLAPGRHEFRVRGDDGSASSSWATHGWQVFAAETPPRVIPSITLTPDFTPPPPDPPPPPKKLFFKLPAPKISAECAIVWEAAGNKPCSAGARSPRTKSSAATRGRATSRSRRTGSSPSRCDGGLDAPNASGGRLPARDHVSRVPRSRRPHPRLHALAARPRAHRPEAARGPRRDVPPDLPSRRSIPTCTSTPSST